MPQQLPVKTGDVVDNCRIEKMLGEGGFGAVYQALHLGLEQPRALKFLFPALGANAAMRKRFLNEARHTARLSHPNIVTVHNVGEHQGMPFINMELIHGSSLGSWLEQGPVDLDAALRVIDQVLAALAYAHDKGLVHRDVKPDNTMVCENGCAKVVDFGLSLNTGSGASRVTQHTKARMGTPYYMAPEQWTTSSVSAAADVWSTGAMLYELVAGQLPFDGNSLLEIMHRIANLPHRPLTELAPNASPALSQLVDRMLCKQLDQRIGDAQDARQELHKAASHLFGPKRLVHSTPQRMLLATVRAEPFPDGLEQIEPLGGTQCFRRHCDDGQMVLLPGADFTMGSDEGDVDERPAHSVRMSPFLIDRVAVSRRQFAGFLSLWGSDSDDDGRPLLDLEIANIDKLGLLYEPLEDGQEPVTGVTWYGAQTYATWAGMSLASEAQLEYAMLRVAEATEQDASEEIDQLIGRVRHWCADSYDDRFYEQHRDADPVNKDTCVFASIRGLSRLMVPLSWSRSRREMSGRHELAIDLGFRCVYVLTHGAS